MKTHLLLAWLCAAFCDLAIAQEEEKAPMYFVQADVRDVAKYYESLTGSKVLADGLSGTIYISTGPLTKARRIEVIEETLFAAGYSLIEPQPGSIRILSRRAPVATEELPVFTEATGLPDRERVVTYVYPLKSRKPAEFAEALFFMFPEFGGRAPAFAPDEKEKAIRITARTTAIRNVLKVIAELDPPAKK